MNITGEIYKFWQGNLTLWKSYWIVGELVNAIIIVIIFNVEIYFFNNIQILQSVPLLNFNDLNYFNKIIIFFWTIFITVGIWKSAEKYRGRFLWTVLTLVVLSYRIFVLKEIFY